MQAGTIRDVHVSVYEAMLTAPTPRQLLPVPAVWTDRTSDLDQLATATNRLAADSARIIAISGPCGVGKTALANRFLYGLRDRFPGGALYADLRGYAPGGPASTPEILGRFLRSVRPGIRTGAVDELGAWWRTATDDPARPMCVLLDNAVDADQVRALLPGGPGHVVVTTSRSVLGHLASHGAQFHQVQPLTDEAAREYLGRCLGQDRVTGEDRAAARIVQLSAGLPMALAVLVGALASWALRLRNDDDGQGLNELGAALSAGRGHVQVVSEGPGHRTVLAFLPDHPEEGVGTLARVRTSEGPDGDVVFERSAERPMELWAEAGENLRRIVPLLGPDAPPADEPEDCQLCPGCYGPVYESSTSHTLIGAGPMPMFGLCRLCAEGTTLRSLRQADVPIGPQQRAVLETVAAAMA